ncbi:Ger(x)C family spore germination protein [Priestia sp. Y58]|uniref:Ger(x)C family spore germination protein n=1 Tax=Priestia TaxID=2800373 RepID=UPI001C8EA6AF|nr:MULTISPECIES: Ger(x)C family spore germination protein [Priestia]MBX9987372.1 Ger(x)C family spore germination protein [Priestia aryabhattai]MBX9998755.1 Ger(x)C family spore germination protein [Priestia aryabhattai]MDG0032184.1 Ger(x)C family spore germination protein [Priestia sp. Y58]MDG0060187.1 Ger(x)C family spore germination protein [Priestia sp. P5]UYV54650.1 Ger(x)C family spore germination protein [Priestia megaterium]
MNTNLSLLWITAICLLFSGCSNYRELNQIGVIIGMGIDQNDSSEQPYKVTYQVINPSGLSQGSSSGGQGLPVINYTVTAQTLVEALKKASVVIPREHVTSHLSLIIFGEKLARNGLALSLDALDRGKQARTSIPIFIARGGTAENLLGVIEPFEVTPVKSILSTSQNNQKMYGIVSNVQAYEVISALSSEGKDLSLPGISINKGSKNEKQAGNLERTNPSAMQVKGLAMFRKGKLVRWLDEEKARSVQFVTSEVKNTALVLPLGEKENATVTMTGVKSQIKTEIRHDQPIVHTNLNVMGEITETSYGIDLSNPKVLKEFEKKIQSELKKQITETICIAQKEKTDIFGFGDSLSRTNPSYWRHHKQNWDDLFSDAKISIKVNANIVNSGMRTNTYEIK